MFTVRDLLVWAINVVITEGKKNRNSAGRALEIGSYITKRFVTRDILVVKLRIEDNNVMLTKIGTIRSNSHIFEKLIKPILILKVLE